MAGFESRGPDRPLWLLLELTYRCPLQCVYCSNPLSFAKDRHELDTDTWLRVLREARALGAVQLGLSGGEPLLRDDLEAVVAEASALGYYTNLITSGMGLNEARLGALREAGLDHIQLSLQGSNPKSNDFIAGAKSFDRKIEVARLVKRFGYPMVLNVVLHRHNIDSVPAILSMAAELRADYLELANVQFGGWAQLNRDHLLPTRAQLDRAEVEVARFRDYHRGSMRVFYVVSDYHESRPKACTAGWGRTFMQITPSGVALPCHGAPALPGMRFPRVDEASVAEIWASPEFERFRGEDWMKDPCRTCPERSKDFGGCRCQAFALTGDPANADPVCSLSPHHDVVEQAVERAGRAPQRTLVYRNSATSRSHSGKVDLPRA